MQSDGKTTKYFYNDIGSKVREEFDIYKFYYLNHGELYQVKVSNVTTVSYSYDDNYNLTEERYANDDVIRYKYNANGDVVSQYHNSNAKPYVTYTYNADNELTEKVNTDTGLKYVYGENNQVSVYKTADNSLVQSYTEQETEADEENGVEGSKTVNEIHFGTSYSSVVKDKSVLYSSNDHIVEYSYQTSGKEDDEKISSDMVKNGDVTALSSAYAYDEDGNVTKKAVTYNGGTADFVNAYDKEGRITTASAFGKNVNYTYDENDQLVSADGDNYNASYSYDARGNITSELVNGETTSFTYANTGWKDQLVSVNGTELTYDAVGNVLTYGDKEYLWNTGRHLASITDGDNEYTYTYDENGIRTSKTVNDITTYYNTKDGVILSQTDGTNTMYFQYDNSGTPLGFVYNETQYFYVTNQMGDVIGITEANGNLLAQYAYDDWGKLLAIDTADAEGSTAYREIAEANPLRYRGYYFDSETGYYYLQSRYYAPEICRFINADVPEIAKVSKDIANGINIFAYCNNNPVNNTDYTGLITPANLIGAIIGAIIGVVGGYFLSRWFADKLHLSGWKRNVFIAGLTAVITASAAAIGYFLGPYVKKAATTLINSLRASFKPKIGTKVGRLGKLIKNTKPQIKGLTKHGLKRIQERGISKKLAQEIVKKGYAVAQNNGKVLYFTKKGVVVLNKAGEIVTAYSAKYFDTAMQGIIKLFFK